MVATRPANVGVAALVPVNVPALAPPLYTWKLVQSAATSGTARPPAAYRLLGGSGEAVAR